MKRLNCWIVVGAMIAIWPAGSAKADDFERKLLERASQPIDLPPLATYKLDRASLDDPTADYSVQQAQGGELRQRDKKAAFVRINLPEPFENRVEIRTLLPEPPLVAPVPQPPK